MPDFTPFFNLINKTSKIIDFLLHTSREIFHKVNFLAKGIWHLNVLNYIGLKFILRSG